MIKFLKHIFLGTNKAMVEKPKDPFADRPDIKNAIIQGIVTGEEKRRRQRQLGRIIKNLSK